MVRYRRYLFTASLGIALLFSVPTVAADNGDETADETAEETGESDAEDESEDAEEESPWNGSLSVGASVNLVSNQDVVGQNNGFSALIGVNAQGQLDYESGPDIFKGTLSLNESFSRTPTLQTFVQTDDALKLNGLYKRKFLPWAGLFAQLIGESAIFRNYQVSEEPKDYRLSNNDGTVTTRSQTQRLQTTELFRPAALEQSVGAFATFIDMTQVNLSSRLSFTARETFANNVYVVEDDDATPATELNELQDVYQGGFKAFVGVEGEFKKQDLTYELGLSALLPVINNDDQDRNALELTRLAASGSVTFSAFDWLSANYNLDIVRDPQVVDAIQIQNSVLLTFTYDIIERRTSDEPSTEEKLENAKDRIEKLETRIEKSEDEDGDDESTDDSESMEDGSSTDEESDSDS